jgi:hypothetical protein
LFVLQELLQQSEFKTQAPPGPMQFGPPSGAVQVSVPLS